jgi:cytochrome o ubiquinol oxidase subunit 1
MAILGVFGAFATFLIFAFRNEDETKITADRIAQFDRAHQAEAAL